MARRLIECVPNFSEGRDPEKVAALAETVRAVPGVTLLGQELDADHNRSVLTFAGGPEAVSEAAVRVVGKAVELIDLNRHTGVHPRIGAADVVPFVPIQGLTLEDCVRIAEWAGQEIWRRFRVPVYFYEAAARRADRVNLENLRRGQFEVLRQEVLTNPERAPDVGEPRLHPTAGATVVGARKFLIAFNINLSTPDVEIAKRVARAIRFSSGGFRYVKAIGVPLASRNLAQVSINLTDFEQTPMHRVFEAVRTEAARYGAGIAGSEIVGLIPKRALEMAAEFYLSCENFHPDLVLENRLAAAAPTAAVSELLASLAASDNAAAGAGAAALVAAAAAALASGAAAQAGQPEPELEGERRELAEIIERLRVVLEGAPAESAPGAGGQPPREEPLKQVVAMTLDVAERSFALLGRLQRIEGEAGAESNPSLAAAATLARAARTAALTCARGHLESIDDTAFIEKTLERLEVMECQESS